VSEIKNLDDPGIYQQLDPQGMLKCLHEMPELCQRAWQMAMDFELPRDYADVCKVVVLGMGGSAIGGDLVRTLVDTEAKLPILVHRDYSLPALVDAQTLVIASSYSGMTEETLAASEQALATEAKKLVITTGGKLRSLAESRGIPVFTFSYKAQPRAALPFSFLPILGVLQRLGIIRDKSADVAEAVRVLEGLSTRINEMVPLSANPAKQLAQKLYGHLPVIYGGGILAEVARRWKTQINENSKTWAFHEVFPELNHNAVVGYQFPAELASKILVVLLRSASLPQRISLRYKVTGQLLEQAGVPYHYVDGEGKSYLSQMTSLIFFGDYVSYYLAMLYEIDPSPVETIAYLKEQLAKG
jgi:glucose/mannose-6-phosphate isomerase